MKIINESKDNYQVELDKLLDRESPDRDPEVVRAVEEIIDSVREEGDRALFRYARKFDGSRIDANSAVVSSEEIDQAMSSLPDEILASLQKADERITGYHKNQLEEWKLNKDTDITDNLGVRIGQRVRPMESVGIYVPGGKAAYPSSVLMGAIPAKVAGVKKVIMVSPQREDKFHPYLLAAAKLAGVDRIFRIGGAHAVAAMAYGTETIPRVDKIVGPGNAYVTAAKRMVFGAVDIDMIAGPTEIVIISDGSANPAFVAADLLSQAEHDEQASSIFITTREWEAKAVQGEVVCQLEGMKRKDIAQKSIDENGAIILVSDLDKAVNIANRIAPEHLELMCKNPRKVFEKIHSAGAVFIGPMTPEPFGDYIAGSNHILPTGGAARFRSPLGVYDFFKRTSVIEASAKALVELGGDVIRLAELEGLHAHANAIAIRLKKEESKK